MISPPDHGIVEEGRPSAEHLAAISNFMEGLLLLAAFLPRKGDGEHHDHIAQYHYESIAALKTNGAPRRRGNEMYRTGAEVVRQCQGRRRRPARNRRKHFHLLWMDRLPAFNTSAVAATGAGIRTQRAKWSRRTARRFPGHHPTLWTEWYGHRRRAVLPS